jgi:hypothetical protein
MQINSTAELGCIATTYAKGSEIDAGRGIPPARISSRT